jgi:predicted nucleotide-binding protein
MQVALFRGLGTGTVDVLNFCITFLWAGNSHNENVRNFLDQIARPFLRDFERHIRRLEQLRPQLIPVPIVDNAPGGSVRNAPMADPRKIFVVYGRDEPLRKSMFEFLRSIGLVPLEWTQAISLTGQGSPYIGDVIARAFEVAQAILVVLSPDDEVRLSPSLCGPTEDSVETTVNLQPRPNVLFEAGMAFGSKPDRTILVEVGAVKRFSDVAGRHAVRLDNTPERRLDLVNRMQSAGCSTDVIGTDWLAVGTFEVVRGAEAPVAPVVGRPASPSVKYVDLAYPTDAGLVAELEKDGHRVKWCSDDRLTRLLDMEGWQLVRRTGEDGGEYILKLHDRPFDQTLIMRRE